MDDFCMNVCMKAKSSVYQYYHSVTNYTKKEEKGNVVHTHQIKLKVYQNSTNGFVTMGKLTHTDFGTAIKL